jgi:L-asparaginase II
MKMVTKEEVDKARADYAVAIKVADAAAEATEAVVDATWDKYTKLKEAFENDN